MAKAYDRVEWSFLESMLCQLGFHVSVVNLIMRCVSSVSFRAFLLTVSPVRFSNQAGDSARVTLYRLFFSCFVQKLSLAFFAKLKIKDLFRELGFAALQPRISHLLFADDCIIFGRVNEKEVGVIGAILKKYEDVSGQQVNLSKFSISFSSGVLEETRNMLAAKLGVSCQGQNGVYLGIPSVVGRSKVEIFQMLVDRTRKKAKDWKRKFLSEREKQF
ncbi:uncharacterized protein LOC131026077 [Salvia miltiorrhiza]|uniref:uncharacterized protein LOC131026077 n=1 Tax=Salvia miltiorrhiza TaxID=226208 RepID=UPI0025AD0493|nr:uncharacterized protein LOC131026077 [Salvia miltiorrhiza]